MELKNLKELLQMYKKYTITGMTVFATAAVLTTGCGTTKTGDAAEGTTGATNETTEEDANELIRITVLDIKQAILDYATLYMERCLMKRSLANEQETEEYQPEAQEYTPPGNGKKKRPNLPAHAKDILSSWFSHHVEHPYPTQSEKVELSERTGLSLQKVDNWFINERSRKWQSYRRK